MKQKLRYALMLLLDICVTLPLGYDHNILYMTKHFITICFLYKSIEEGLSREDIISEAIAKLCGVCIEYIVKPNPEAYNSLANKTRF